MLTSQRGLTFTVREHNRCYQPNTPNCPFDLSFISALLVGAPGADWMLVVHIKSSCDFSPVAIPVPRQRKERPKLTRISPLKGHLSNLSRIWVIEDISCVVSVSVV